MTTTKDLRVGQKITLTLEDTANGVHRVTKATGVITDLNSDSVVLGDTYRYTQWRDLEVLKDAYQEGYYMATRRNGDQRGVVWIDSDGYLMSYPGSAMKETVASLCKQTQCTVERVLLVDPERDLVINKRCIPSTLRGPDRHSVPDSLLSNLESKNLIVSDAARATIKVTLDEVIAAVDATKGQA